MTVAKKYINNVILAVDMVLTQKRLLNSDE